MAGNDLIKYLKETKNCTLDNSLFTDIIKTNKKFNTYNTVNLNSIPDLYFDLEDREEAIIICLAPIELLINELCKRVFYSHSSIETYNNFDNVDSSSVKQEIVTLHFGLEVYKGKPSSFKIPVFYSECFQDYEGIILATKRGNKEFLLDFFPPDSHLRFEERAVYERGYIYRYPKYSPYLIAKQLPIKKYELYS